MTVTTPDTIERIVELPVPIERAWQAVATPEGVSTWLPDKSEFEPIAGNLGTLTWGEQSFRMRIETVDPPRHFAWRWSPQPDNDHTIPFEELSTTLVDFVLEQTEMGTRLTVTESGFASLPDALQAKCHSDNSQGWTEELGELVAYLSGTAS